MKIKKEGALTIHSQKVTKEVYETVLTQYVSNKVEDENYNEAFASIYTEAFRKYFETNASVKIVSKEDALNLDWKLGQIFNHQNFEYSVEENWDDYFISEQKAKGVTGESARILYYKLFKSAVEGGAIIYVTEPEIELCWGYSKELDTNHVVFNWNIEFAVKEN